jgi:hypothetical protein
MVRLVGIPLACLGVFIVQLIRHRVAALYPTTLLDRSAAALTPGRRGPPG